MTEDLVIIPTTANDKAVQRRYLCGTLLNRQTPDMSMRGGGRRFDAARRCIVYDPPKLLPDTLKGWQDVAAAEPGTVVLSGRLC